MARWPIVLGLMALTAGAQQKEFPKRQEPAAQREQEPPEEDSNLVKKEYGFNPLQSTKEIQIGNFYFKKGRYRAAAQRFQEATLWNSGNAEAWLRLAETREKLKDQKAARDAYAKYLELSPDAKNAVQIRKKIKSK